VILSLNPACRKKGTHGNRGGEGIKKEKLVVEPWVKRVKGTGGVWSRNFRNSGRKMAKGWEDKKKATGKIQDGKG